LIENKYFFAKNCQCFEYLGSLQLCDVKVGPQAKKGWEPLT